MKAGSVPWAALTAWGFADDPTRSGLGSGGGGGGGVRGRRGGEGPGADGGADDITFVVLPGDRYILYTRPADT